MIKCFTKSSDVMKICAAQAMMALIVCGVSAAHDNHAQLLDTKITLSLKEVSFELAVKKIGSASRVNIFYSIDQLDVIESVSIEAKDETLRDVLDDLLSPYGIRYKVNERKRAVILKKQTATRASEEANLNESPFILSGQFQPATITGMVRDAISHQPMAGVNIILKGTTVGTTTDSEGHYSIEAEDHQVFVFSFIGYVTFETQVGDRRVIDVSMVEDITNLDEVVVNAGYWKVADRERTGNISRVTAEDIKDQPVSNPLMAIQGRMPGVVITQTSGVPGSGMKIQIRGQNSLRATQTNNGNLPLYVIDGVPVASNPTYLSGELLGLASGGIDPLNTLNPANIESVEILKDADATAIYGSRGANGVVLITTKKGQAGKTHVDVQAYTGAGRVSKMIDVMDTEQYVAMRNEAFEKDNATLGASDYDLNGTWSQTDDTDWQRKLIGGTANISDFQGFISGGSGNTSFRFGGGYHTETTVFPGSFGYSKAMGSLNLNHTTSDQKFRIVLSVNYGRDNNDLFSANIAAYARTLPPNAPSFDDLGNLVWTGYNPGNPNPYSYFEVSNANNTGNLITNTVLRYELFKGFQISANLGYTDVSTNQIVKTPLTAISPAAATQSSTSVLQASGRNWIAEPLVSYARELGGGRIEFLAGVTWQAFDSKNVSATGRGYASDALLGNIRSATTVIINNDTYEQYRYNAVFGRLSYIWREKYLINLTARRDGSSRFGEDSQFGNFGAIGAAWIFSSENFVKRILPFVSFGKIRASYGATGSDQIGNYGYLSTYSPSSATYEGTSILNTTSLANPNFGWEVNKKLEAALELTFFDNRIQTSTSWYRNSSSNQLVGYPLPSTTGFTSVQYNLDATVQNTGCEFEITTVNVEASNFQWTTSLNLTVPRNKLVSYPNLAGSSYANTYIVGKPLTISKRYIYDGIDPETGSYKIVDVNNDGSHTDVDRQAVVDLSRKYYGGLNNAIRFKSIELNFLIEFNNQNAIDYRSQFVSQPGGRMYNQLASILSEDRWQNIEDEAALQKFTQLSSATYARAAASDLNVTDASYIRMKTISLSYRLPQMFQKVKLNDVSVYLQSQNLFTITKYYGFNPESPFSELPPLRVYCAGLKLKI